MLVWGNPSEQYGGHCFSGNDKRTQLAAALPQDTLQEGQGHISSGGGPQPWLPVSGFLQPCLCHTPEAE